MELVLLLMIAGLILCVVYLQLRLWITPRPTVVVMPNTSEQDSGIGCAALALMIVLAAILLAVMGVLPPID